MHVSDETSQDPVQQEDKTADPLRRFRSWRGFLFAAVAVNLLFTYAMLNNTADTNNAIWFKVLVWLPFNTIASALYIVFMIKLGNTKADDTPRRPSFYSLFCMVMIGANWYSMFAA